MLLAGVDATYRYDGDVLVVKAKVWNAIISFGYKERFT